MSEPTEDSVQRWTAKRRAALVVSILKGETSVAEAARKHGLTVADVEDWQQRFLLGAENALRSRPKDEEALKEEQIKKLKQSRMASSNASSAVSRRNVSGSISSTILQTRNSASELGSPGTTLVGLTRRWGIAARRSFERRIWSRWPHDEGRRKIDAHNCPRTSDRHPVRSEGPAVMSTNNSSGWFQFEGALHTVNDIDARDAYH